MYLNVHCRAIFMSDLDSSDSVDAKNDLTHLDWTPDTRDTEWVLKWVLIVVVGVETKEQNSSCSSSRSEQSRAVQQH